jgi:SAM-dependent methyltransferase
VGLDASAEALAQARQTLSQQQLPWVRLVQADINSTDRASINPDGWFDLAFCRLFLMHQTDPAKTVRQVAQLVRPGGRIIAQDILLDVDFPRIDPPVPAANRVDQLVFANMSCIGASPDVARHYGSLFAQAGLRPISHRGCFSVDLDAQQPLHLFRDILTTTRQSMVRHEVATDAEIDGLLQSLSEVDPAQTHFAAWGFMVEFIAEVPDHTGVA